ncbi:FMRFamide receptor-like isoform X2 [Tubulanus polymorphus]|uniref:FMRFamide receptor-like isoform X2 n=1 Tax=Tubulanus polymorphus TaxID=672921 RepID=UPI003DA261A3
MNLSVIDIAKSTSKLVEIIHQQYHLWEVPILHEMPHFPREYKYSRLPTMTSYHPPERVTVTTKPDPAITENTTTLSPSINVTTTAVSFLFADIRFYVYVVVIGIMCFLGIIFNTISIIVLNKDNQSTINFFLKALALSDILSLLMMLIHHTFSSIYPYTGLLENYYRDSVYMIPYIWPLRMMVNTMCMLVITAITIDRYIRVCHSDKVLKWAKLRNAYITMVVIVILSASINIPRFFVIKTSSCYVPETNRIMVYNELTQFYREYFPLIYTLDSIGYFIPFFALIVFNSILLITVHRSRQKQPLQQKTSTGSFSGRVALNVTATLITIVIIFIVCETPIRIYRLLVFLKSFTHHETAQRFSQDEKTTYYIQLLGDTLTTFDCFVNLFVFTFVGQRFRRILVHMLLCRKGPWQSYNAVPSPKSNTFSLRENEKKNSI